MKNKTTLILNVGLLLFYIAQAIFYSLYGSREMCILSGLLLGFWSFFMLNKYLLNQTKVKSPDMVVQGYNTMQVHMECVRYVLKGYRVSRVYHKRKYVLFGDKMLCVELNADPIVMQANQGMPLTREQIISFGQAFHDSADSSFDISKKEPTDEELIAQQRFEELAERMKKRNTTK